MKRRERPSWDEYFINLVLATKKRSSCLKREVGALIVTGDGKTLLTTGYNGAPRGIDSCFEKNECWRRKNNIPHGENKDLCMGSHAEANAIYSAARNGISLDSGKLYVTTFPCVTCAKGIVQVGLTEVKYLEDYYGAQHDLSEKILRKAKIKLTKLEYKAS